MKRVLIVEDHPLFREGLVQLLNLRLRDCQFIAVASAEEGLAEAPSRLHPMRSCSI